MSNGPPASRRPTAKLEHLQDMGTVAFAGPGVVVTSRTGSKTEWRKLPGSEWFERVDAAAPVAPEGSVVHEDPREAPATLVLSGQAAPKAKSGPGSLAALLDKLDADQRTLSIDLELGVGKVVRALAAAGSGKTTSLVACVGRLDRDGLVQPSDVVITTFTAKAGGEILSRLKATMPKGRVPEKVSTFHALAYRQLKMVDPARWDIKRCTDLSKGHSSRDDAVPSTRSLWRMVLDGSPRSDLFDILDRPGLGIDNDDNAAATYTSALDMLRSRPLARAQLLEAAAVHELKQFAEGVGLYFQAKEKLRVWDWADATEAWHAALLRGEMGGSARLVCVDEAQDCSRIQLETARLLAAKGTLLLIGDVRQAIYEWRGASPEILARADEDLGATTLQLRRNYRSGYRIVELGNAICEEQEWAVGDPAMPVRKEPGQIEFRGDNLDGPEEAEGIADEIEEGTPGGSAVLCRTRALSALVEAALMAHGIPCAVAGGSSFFDSKVAKDSLALYALSVAGVGGVDEAYRVRSIPRTRYLGKRFFDRVRELGGDVVNGIRKACGETSCSDSQAKNARELADLIVELRRIGWAKVPVLVARLIGSMATAGTSERDDGSGDTAALAGTMAMVAARFDSPREVKRFADKCTGDVKALDEGATDEGRVVISTIHKAKGLEWDTVYVAGLTKGVFPHSKSETPEREAEERRLFYVAVTRAKNRLVLSWANRTPFGGEGGPSAFAELAREAVLGGEDSE